MAVVLFSLRVVSIPSAVIKDVHVYTVQKVEIFTVDKLVA